LTTPESLAILLARRSAAEWCADLRWVIVDEVHALAANKRGADLALSLERLEWLARGPLQRVGLSATCAPLEKTAKFLVGMGRSCALAQVPDRAALEIRIEPLEEGPGFVTQIIRRLVKEIRAQQTILVFANSRAMAERLCWSLTQMEPGLSDAVAVHHGSLDAGRRRNVERRLKAGRLRVVISSTSLELGIDIGSVDLVVLVHPPGDVVRLLQRIGRAGHAPGRPRQGLVLTASARELLEATVTSACGQAGETEPLKTVRAPLDVLCQQLIGIACGGGRDVESTFHLVRRAYPYRELSRQAFDDCLRYLTGEPGLTPRIRVAGGRFTITDDRTARLMRRNLGTIISVESRSVRLFEPKADDGLLPLGELDEAYADRLKPGDRILLDHRCLEVQRADPEGVTVEERSGRPIVPKWVGDGGPLTRELARRLYTLRTRAAEALHDGPKALEGMLRGEYGLEARAARMLTGYFEEQERVSEIPDERTCLVEAVPGAYQTECYVHTLLNRAGNDGLARVAVRRLACRRGGTVTSIVADLGFMVAFGPGAVPDAHLWREVLSPAEFMSELDAAVEDSLLLRERFRRAALIGLMLLQRPLGGPRKVGGSTWAERRLFERIRDREPDFVLLRQARAEVREEACDGPAALAYLEKLAGGAIRCRLLRGASPFSRGWTQADVGAMEMPEDPARVLLKLHSLLMAGKPSDARPYRLAADA
jgi:ATP-dependent Lhr-like helicase